MGAVHASEDVDRSSSFPGCVADPRAAAVAMVLSLAFGVLFAVARLSERRWISVPAGAVVEFFRAVPLLLMIFFLFFGVPFLFQGPFPAFWAVVIGLTLYNGSVLAEVFRAGILSVPRAVRGGVRARPAQDQVMQLDPAAAGGPGDAAGDRQPAVVLLKDTALGYIVAFPELLRAGCNVLAAIYGNVVAAASSWRRSTS